VWWAYRATTSRAFSPTAAPAPILDDRGAGSRGFGSIGRAINLIPPLYCNAMPGNAGSVQHAAAGVAVSNHGAADGLESRWKRRHRARDFHADHRGQLSGGHFLGKTGGRDGQLCMIFSGSLEHPEV